MPSPLRRLLPLLAAVLIASGGVSHAGAENGAFVSVIDDLPLMRGFAEVGKGVEFSTAQGRIVEATAIQVPDADATEADVLAFYAETLPQLGWSRAGEKRFQREGEVLELLFGRSAGRLTVRFSLAPASN